MLSPIIGTTKGALISFGVLQTAMGVSGTGNYNATAIRNVTIWGGGVLRGGAIGETYAHFANPPWWSSRRIARFFGDGADGASPGG